MTDDNNAPNQAAIGSEKEFLHDLCNSLAISYGNIKLLSVKMQSDPSMDHIKIQEKLEKALKSFDRANSLLDQRRNFIRASS